MAGYRSPQQIWRDEQAQKGSLQSSDISWDDLMQRFPNYGPSIDPGFTIQPGQFPPQLQNPQVKGAAPMGKAPPGIWGQAKDQLINLGTGAAIKEGAKAGGEALGYSPADVGGFLAAAKGIYDGGKVLASDLKPEDKGREARQVGEDAIAGFETGGISSLVQLADRKLLGGQIDKWRDKAETAKAWGLPVGQMGLLAANPYGFMISKGIEGVSKYTGSSKGKDQVRRDAVRKMLQNGGFFGESKDGTDWGLDNPDGTSFDVGKDGGARLEDGRRYYDIDPNNKNPVQGQAIGAVNPLAYLITGGDEKLATNFAGYFTNTIMQGDGSTNQAVTIANALDKYKKAGYDTPEKAIAGIDDLVKAGKLDPAKAAAFKGGIASVFSTPQAQRSDRSRNSMQNQGGKRRDNGRGRRPTNVYQIPEKSAPQVLSQNSTAPMGSNSPYGDQFAQSLANIYMSNQGLA